MKFKNILFLFTTLSSILFFIACDKKKKKNVEEEIQFDKAAMLTNYADNVILPNFQSFKVTLDSLVNAFNVFVQNKTVANLTTVRQKYINTNIKFQYISPIEFGPSETEIVRSNFNTFPTDTVQINLNVSTGSYNLGTISNLDAKGFPALDFLLFGNNSSDVSIVTLFDTDSKATNRIAYVNACLTEMQSKTNTIINSWNSGYRNTFISSLSTDIGSSIGYLVNQLNFELDNLKNNKIGIPLGKKTLGIAEPTKCEAYYGGQSVKYASETLNAIENLYLGRSQAGLDGKGFDDYLEHLKSEYNGQPLNSAIKNQFSIAKLKLAAIQNPLSTQVITNAAVVDAAYLELLKLLVLLKTDMPSSLGVIITYQDGDGD